ncbi:YiiD C-terminal domain-containing protein [Pseudomonas sp. PDM15]|jgi:acyl-coenzyme A thioesterase PaaI-like protein|uniref:YiiD C-terminal domain-containing protein n=1 Tax=Pseudomonas sp. PDM15 TaxID=2769303 RepID=UPI00177C6A85|nr:YiiD C-terminal domain-containing protein [Pseudomonas sp. PDM15]MBD9426563.1 YiiD C-terminal domain-containing protein [Pseudomonas sp. PDM15]
MPLPAEMARVFTEEKIDFVKRSGLKAEELLPGFVRLRMPLAGNQNHIGTLYAGALFTLAEIPGGALFLTSFDVQRFYPLIKEMNLRFRRPATSDISVEARLDTEEIERIQNEAEREGKAEYRLELQLKDADGQVVAETSALYQLRKH